MPPKFYKHKLLLDEGLFPKHYLKRLNNRYNIKHIKHDLHKGGAKDQDVYSIACKERRIIVTYNINDFKILASKNKDSGVIGVSSNILADDLDKKLNALLNKKSGKSLYGKYTPLGNRT